MPQQEQNIIRSEKLRDFIGNRPGLLTRRAIPVFAIVLSSLCIGSYFVLYPDIVQANAVVHVVNGPKPVIAKNGGRLIRLFKKDNQPVSKGEVIGYLESTAEHSEILRLSEILDTLRQFAESNRLEEIPRFWQSVKNPFSHLGELQQAHQQFMQGFWGFKDYLNSGFYVLKKQMLYKDLLNTRRLLETLYEQKKLQTEDLVLVQDNYNLHDTLHDETLITAIEHRNQKSLLVNKKMSIPQINASIIGNEMQQNTLQKELRELDNQIAQQRSVFIQLLNVYYNTVEDWKQKYLVIAPLEGNLVYAGFPEEKQQLQINAVIGYITMNDKRSFAEMLIPQRNFGKVKIGQQVLLKFQSYPYQEFGTVKGVIENIKSLPTDSGYLSRIILPDGLTTNHHKTLNFTEGMTATAEIITNNQRLSDRFIGKIKDLIK